MVQMKILPVILSLYLFGFSKSQSTGILGKLNARGLEFGEFASLLIYIK